MTQKEIKAVTQKEIKAVVEKAKLLNRLYICFELDDTSILIVPLKNVDTVEKVFTAIKEKVYTVEKVFYSDTIKFNGYGGL